MKDANSATLSSCIDEMSITVRLAQKNQFDCWSKNFISITTWNSKRSTRKKIITILKDRERDEFHFIVLKQLIIRKKRLQNIEIQQSKKLKLNITSLLFKKTNFRTESSTWLNRKWWVKILFRHFATEINSWNRCVEQLEIFTIIFFRFRRSRRFRKQKFSHFNVIAK